MKKLLIMLGMLAMIQAQAGNKKHERKVESREPSPGENLSQRGIAASANLPDTLSESFDEAGEFALYIPNTFTPNSDGLNDEFILYGTGVKSIKLEVYNRDGRKIFETQNVSAGWDGSYKGSPCEVATYVYFVEITTNSGSIKNKAGHVNIVR